MKTAMQELIDEIDNQIIGFDIKFGGTKNQLMIVRNNAVRKLQKEKEQIMDAYWQGKEDDVKSDITLGEQSEEYYNQTYNQNK